MARSFLSIPSHVANHILKPVDFNIPIIVPFQRTQDGQILKQSSLMSILTCWNTMMGAGIVTLPWAFSHSGFLLGIIICFVGFLVSLRTCILILRLTGPGDDFFDTCRKYWGMPGYLTMLICTLALVLTACTSYYMIMAQVLYPNFLALLYWIFGVHI